MNYTTPTATSNPSLTPVSLCASEMLSKHNSVSLYVIPAALLGILIMALNLLVVVAVIKNKKLHKAAFYYVCSLAVADFVVGFITLFSFVRIFFKRETTTLELELRQGIYITSVGASILTLLFISLNRYFAIVHPFHYRAKMNNIIVGAAIALTWVYSIVGGFLPVAGWNAKNDDCSEIIPGLARSYVLMVSVHVIVILVVILALYLRIFCKVRTSSHTFSGDSRSSEDKAHIKVAKTLFIVTAAFAVCWLPFMIICILDFAHSIKLANYTPFFYFLATLNSGFNPIIYAWRDIEMRKTFKNILCPCQCCSGPTQDTAMESSTASTRSTLLTLCYGSPTGARGDEGPYEKHPTNAGSLERQLISQDNNN